MKPILTLIAASTLAGALAHAQTPHYTITDLGTFGGMSAVAFGINNAGRIGGAANLPGELQRPFLSGIAGKTDLGTLGGPNAQTGTPNGTDQMAILSEMSKMDPLGEDFCGFGSHLICLGAFWNGTMTPLPTLGGNNAMALALNDRGQIIGVAENSIKDKSCPSPQVLDFEAAMWSPAGQIQELPPLSGDIVGFALGINALGQVVGSSGTCDKTGVTANGLFYGAHAVLWQNGAVTDLGNLGGTQGKAGAINNRGEVAGFSGLPGDTTVHAFLWTAATGMQDLGGIGADVLGDPAGINDSTQVVGGSCDSDGNCRAFFYGQDKKMTDLNTLIPANSPLYLIYALGINDAGEIVGVGADDSGNVRAYLATPIRSTGATASSVPVVASPSRPRPTPESARKLLRQRLGMRGR